MTATIGDLKNMYERGNTGEYSHMVVLHDTFDFENYPVYVKHGDDPKVAAEKDSGIVDECYSYALGWEAQSVEPRARHWEYDPKT